VDYLKPLARLAGPGYRVHRYDQRGCGRSEAQRPWTLEQFITDLDGLRAHFGYPRWIAGGHSFGADLALRYALRYPHRVTGLVYICGTGLEWNLHTTAHKTAARPGAASVSTTGWPPWPGTPAPPVRNGNTSP
jgi:proline iminopeptidase